MKKILALILAAVMALSMAACGGNGSAVDPAQIVGTVSGSTYTNTFFGMTVTLDSNWSVATEAEMAEIFGMTQEALAEVQIDNSGVDYGMYASRDEGLTTLNVVMENLGVLYGMTVDEQGYAEIAVQQLPSALESLGMSDVTTEITTVNFAGSEHVAVQVHGTLYEVDFYETLACVKQGNYIAVITVGCYGEDITGDVLALFTAV